MPSSQSRREAPSRSSWSWSAAARSMACIAAIASLGSCGGHEEPAVSPRRSPHAASNEGFAELRDRIVTAELELCPVYAQILGFHDHDGRVRDVSTSGVKRWLEELRRERDALARVDASRLSPDDALDKAVLDNIIGTFLRLRRSSRRARRRSAKARSS